MTEKIAVFGGDLFWTNLPYEALNYYEKLKNSHEHVDLILFAKDNTVNMGSLLGYYGLAKFKNNSILKAEMFATACEISESSK